MPEQPFADTNDSDTAAVSPANDSQPRPDPYEGAVPPGYDWPTHGGYLGCLLSLIVSVLVGGFLGSTLFAALSYYSIVPRVVSVLLTIAVFFAVVIALGRLGWALGKRFYREYPQPGGRTWGEDDDFGEEGTEPAASDAAPEQAPDEKADTPAPLSSPDGDPALTHAPPAGDGEDVEQL